MLNIESFYKGINEYLDGVMSEYRSADVCRSKAIHDSIHQTNFFKPHEVAVIDLPIVQRLRRVSQTDVASYVYPSANHSRFEHTLGVTVLAGKFIEALWAKPEIGDLLQKLSYDKDFFFNHARIAAILHDVGHGPFSHLSEQLYGKRLVDGIKASDSRLQGASPHEILSFCITTSKSMRRFNSDVLEKKYGVEINLDLVADIIVGNTKSHEGIDFLIEIINGGFDADKLDYMLRDAHATGLQMSLDLSRLLYALNLYQDENRLRLGIDMRGALALEQIIFNKMTLTASVYHHHKVRAAGCMLKDIVSAAIDTQKPELFPQYTDDDILTNACPLSAAATRNFKNRRIPKRALTISHKNINNEKKDSFYRFMELHDKADLLEKIKNAIVDQVKSTAGKDVLGDIWIDIPNTPKFKEALTTKITDGDAATITLKELFPVDDWVNAYSQNKWKAYVFCYEENLEVVAKASKDVFSVVYDLKF